MGEDGGGGRGGGGGGRGGREGEGGVGRTESFDGLTYGLIWLIPTVSTEVSEELKAKEGLVAKVLVYSFACFVRSLVSIPDSYRYYKRLFALSNLKGRSAV